MSDERFETLLARVRLGGASARLENADNEAELRREFARLRKIEEAGRAYLRLGRIAEYGIVSTDRLQAALDAEGD